MRVTPANIAAARRSIAGHVLHAPMLPAPRLSVLTGASVLVNAPRAGHGSASDLGPLST